MRVAILDDVHCAYEGTTGVKRLRDRAEVHILPVLLAIRRALASPYQMAFLAADEVIE